ncbi:MAG: patatin-like phospholipase family protein [Vicinamibacteria bacterium]|nr:patatin-like phospholipase family protein [Vicinamibacteria bacterium]
MQTTDQRLRRTPLPRHLRGQMALALAALIGATGSRPASAQGHDAPPSRPLVGVALGGGSARGMAHAGVLQWLEEHHIPVDRIAGNSTGALLGGAYAAGMSADAIKTLLRNADWDTILRPDLPYPLRSFRRKEDDFDYSIKLEAGLRHGFRLQSGLNPGHQLSLLISRIMLPYSGVLDFDDLPIPFRCVATDLEKGEAVVFDSGPIAPAIRASMARPGTYDPVRLNGRLFADGGILNNVPVDVAKAMGADVVIAVRVGPRAEEKTSETIAGIANRSISLMMQSLERTKLSLADVVIVPDLGELSGADFRKSDEFVALGYKATEGHKDALLRYALDEASWTKYQSNLQARKQPRVTPVTFVEVKGVSDGAGAQIAQQLSRHIGRPPNPPAVEEDLNHIIGLGRYSGATYGRLDSGDSTGLGVDIKDKSYGPPFVRFALEVNNENKDISLNLGSRVTLMDVTGLGSEWRIDTSLGSTLAFATEFYQPLGGDRPIRGGAFLAPRASYARTSENLYTSGDLVAIYGRQRAGAGLDLGWNSDDRTRFRLGYDVAYVRNITRVGDPLLPRSTGGEQTLRARFDYDGQDAAYLPSRGLRLVSSAQWFLAAPDSPRRFGAVEGSIRAARPVGSNRILSATIDGGMIFGGKAPVLYQFSLGGPFRLGAFPTHAFRGPKYLLGSLSYRFPIGRLPKLLGGRLYVVGLAEAGGVFDRPSSARIKASASAGMTADTLLGPLFAGVSVGQGGRARVYFMISRLVR